MGQHSIKNKSVEEEGEAGRSSYYYDTSQCRVLLLPCQDFYTFSYFIATRTRRNFLTLVSITIKGISCREG